MNTDYKTIIEVNHGFESNVSRPITTYAEAVQNAKCATLHRHPRAQIISCDKGVMRVITPNQIWIVNSMQSVWIASYEEHQVYFPDNVTIVSAFIDESKLACLPKKSFAFDNTFFIKSLLTKIISFENPEYLTSQQYKIFDVLLDELSLLKPSVTYLPTSEEARIKGITAILLNDLTDRRSIEYYANQFCMSSKTLSRLFVKELGMSFQEWRIRLKMLEAIKKLGEKKPVKEIAYELGYENVSSLIATFKKYFGKTPTNYMENR